MLLEEKVNSFAKKGKSIFFNLARHLLVRPAAGQPAN